jgi:hypothetical protein
VRRDDHQSHRLFHLLGERNDSREQAALDRRRRGFAGAVFVGIHADHPHRHDDDVAIGGGLERAGNVSERVWISDRHEDVARLRVDLPAHQLARRQELEDVCGFERRDALTRLGAEQKRGAHEQDPAGRDQRRRIAKEQRGRKARERHQRNQPQSDRYEPATNLKIPGRDVCAGLTIRPP